MRWGEELTRATNVPPNYQLRVECREGQAQRGRDTGRGGVEEGASLLRLPGPLTLGPAQGLGIGDGPREMNEQLGNPCKSSSGLPAPEGT